jgi:hypothetical protein
MIELDKDAFKGPFPCHGKTVLVQKRIVADDLEFRYSVWQCKCGKEYLDSSQGKMLERFWLLRKVLSDRMIAIERNMNFDGNAYFFRFPKEFTKGLRKGSLVDIKLLDTEGKMFLVEIR